MEERNIYLNLSPLDHRYYLSNKKEYTQLAEYLSEEAQVRYCARVEAALLKALLPYIGGIDDIASIEKQLDTATRGIDTEEVYAEEEKTKHNIRSLVNVLKRKVSDSVAHFVHLGATSMDILDTANSLRTRDCVRNVVIPIIIDLEDSLIRLCVKHADTLQVGRTHGQHAVPITFGFAVAEYVSRLGKSIERLEVKSSNLRGKLSGAVGAYNATSLISSDPEKLETEYLTLLGLKASEHSTQIIESEYLLEVLLEINTSFGIIANLADDLRHLQRSEIREVCEEFSKEQVGSSTMPQKRNPWNCEHVKSMWKAFFPRVMTFYMDQISEHQRDLTNSASARFVADYIAGFVFATARMVKILSSLYVDAEKMMENIRKAGDLVLSEPAYILLALSGVSDAHEKIRMITLESEKTGKPLLEILKKDKDAWKRVCTQLEKVSAVKAEEFFGRPELYTGIASKKALRIAAKYETAMKTVREKIGAIAHD
jgi:adenylosuccinate lyase